MSSLRTAEGDKSRYVRHFQFWKLVHTSTKNLKQADLSERVGFHHSSTWGYMRVGNPDGHTMRLHSFATLHKMSPAHSEDDLAGNAKGFYEHCHTLTNFTSSLVRDPLLKVVDMR